MTIFASHFALVLGAWRLRIRVDLDEPRASELDEPRAAVEPHREAPQRAARDVPAFTPRGWG